MEGSSTNDEKHKTMLHVHVHSNGTQAAASPTHLTNTHTFVQVKQQGQADAEDFALYYADDSGERVSPWHDIPLVNSSHSNDTYYNFVVEIPRG